jgi:hypothetical protein
LILSIFIVVVLSIYWGVLSRVEKKFSSLNVYVVDFDGRVPPFIDADSPPFVGPALTQVIEQRSLEPNPRLGFQIRSPAEFLKDPIVVRQAIYDFRAWAAIVVNPNATSLLYAALQNGGNASYDPFGCAQIIFAEARDEPTIREYIYPALMEFQNQFVAQFGAKWVLRVMPQLLIAPCAPL